MREVFIFIHTTTFFIILFSVQNCLAMLQLFSKYTIAAPSAARSICTKHSTYSASRMLSPRLLPRPQVHPRFFRPNTFNGFATKPRNPSKPIQKAEPTPVIVPKNLPEIEIQTRLLDRLKSAGAISGLQAPPSLSHVYPRRQPYRIPS